MPASRKQPSEPPSPAQSTSGRSTRSSRTAHGAATSGLVSPAPALASQPPVTAAGKRGKGNRFGTNATAASAASTGRNGARGGSRSRTIREQQEERSGEEGEEEGMEELDDVQDDEDGASMSGLGMGPQRSAYASSLHGRATGNSAYAPKFPSSNTSVNTAAAFLAAQQLHQPQSQPLAQTQTRTPFSQPVHYYVEQAKSTQPRGLSEAVDIAEPSSSHRARSPLPSSSRGTSAVPLSHQYNGNGAGPSPPPSDLLSPTSAAGMRSNVNASVSRSFAPAPPAGRDERRDAGADTGTATGVHLSRSTSPMPVQYFLIDTGSDSHKRVEEWSAGANMRQQQQQQQQQQHSFSGLGTGMNGANNSANRGANTTGNTSGFADSSVDRTNHSYSEEDRFVQRELQKQRASASGASKTTASRNGKRTHQSTPSLDANGRKRSRLSAAAHDDARWVPKGDKHDGTTNDSESSNVSDSSFGGDGDGVVAGGALEGRRATRGQKAGPTGPGYLGGNLSFEPHDKRAGLRARNGHGAAGEETDEGHVPSEAEEQARSRGKSKSRGPAAQLQPPSQHQSQTQESLRQRSLTPQPRLPTRSPAPGPSNVNQSYAMPRPRQPSKQRERLNVVLEMLRNAVESSAYYLGITDLPDDGHGAVQASKGRNGRMKASRLQRALAWGLLASVLVGSYRKLVSLSPVSSPKHSVNTGFSPPSPHMPPGSFEELIEQITGMRSAMSAISSANAVLQQHQHSDDERLKRIEGALPEVQRQVQAHLGRLDRMELQSSKAFKEANAITDGLARRMGEVEDDLSGLPASVKKVLERQTQSEASLRAIEKRLQGVEQELRAVLEDGRVAEALHRILPDLLPFKYQNARQAGGKGKKGAAGGGMEIDPTFWVELRKVLVGKDELGETVRRVLRDEVDSGRISAPADKGKGKGNQEGDGKGASGVDWDALRKWQTSLSSKLEDYNSRSISKESFTQLFEAHAMGLEGAIDELRALVAQQAAASASSSTHRPAGSSHAGQQGDSTVTYQLGTKEDITSSLTSLIDAALLRYSKDTIARPDYALYSAGARVLAQITTPTLVLHEPTWFARTIMGKKELEALSPAHALMPGNTPGQCWSFKGQQGQLGVLLKERVVVGDVTVEHAPRENVGDVGAAPREVEVWGLVETQEDLEKVEEYYRWNPLPENASMPPTPEHLLLSTFEYDTTAANHIQTFPVPRAIQELGIKMGVVIWKFKSNWGSEDYTCLYRVRVHGVSDNE